MLYREVEGKKKLVVPATWIDRVLTEAHNQSGHPGVRRLLDLLSDVWWPRMRTTVTSWVQKCPDCQRQKPSTLRPSGLLQPLPIPSAPWRDVSMDLITDLPRSKEGFCSILTVCCRFSKMCHFIPLREDTSAKELAS